MGLFPRLPSAFHLQHPQGFVALSEKKKKLTFFLPHIKHSDTYFVTVHYRNIPIFHSLDCMSVKFYLKFQVKLKGHRKRFS
jgi:hypothetical protein